MAPLMERMMALRDDPMQNWIAGNALFGCAARWRGVETGRMPIHTARNQGLLELDRMRYQKLYSDDAGESHWDDVDVTVETRSFAPPAGDIEISDSEPVKQMLFLRLKSGWNEPIHPTPVKQKLICLAGSVRVTASDGEFRDIGRGDVWHMEDKHGKGHHTRVTSDEDFECVIVQYE